MINTGKRVFCSCVRLGQCAFLRAALYCYRPFFLFGAIHLLPAPPFAHRERQG